jgi:hypothetical protein
MPNMRDGFRYALLLTAGLLAVLFIIAFTAWGLTTYGSIRHVVGDLAAQPDKAADLQDQYQDMVTSFAGSGTTFTFHFRSAPINIGRTRVASLSETEVISLALDTYTSGLYDNNLAAGGLGVAGVFVGSSGNILYAITALVFLVAFILFTAGAIQGFPEYPAPYKMKSAGKTIAAFCAVVFCLFALLPGFLKSLFRGTLANNSGARDIIGIIEPLAVGSLLRNTLIIIVIAGILYAVGYWLGTKGDVQAVFKASHASAQKENVPENHKRRSL